MTLYQVALEYQGTECYHRGNECRKSAQSTSPVGDLGWPLRRAARQFGSADAIVDGERTVTYSQLAGRVAALGASLDALAVGLGGRVGFLGVNSLAHVECWLGVSRRLDVSSWISTSGSPSPSWRS